MEPKIFDGVKKSSSHLAMEVVKDSIKEYTTRVHCWTFRVKQFFQFFQFFDASRGKKLIISFCIL